MKNEISKQIGEAFTKALNEKGISLYALEKKIDLSMPTLTKIKNGTFTGSINTISKVFKELDCSGKLIITTQSGSVDVRLF